MPVLKLCVLVSGGGTNLQAIIDGIASGRIANSEITGVISNNHGAYALERARQAGIYAACIAPQDFPDREGFHERLYDEVKKLNPDLIITAGYLVKIPDSIIGAYAGRIINVHPSLLPAFGGKGCYGLKVHEKALERGVKITGATVHYVNEELDAGPIILQKAVAVEAGDTPETLQKRVMEEAEWVILPQAIDMIARGIY
jgi:phosphoribosylglycinamide formyltransferase-1